MLTGFEAIKIDVAERSGAWNELEFIGQNN
jgi:hypothetical protein